MKVNVNTLKFGDNSFVEDITPLSVGIDDIACANDNIHLDLILTRSEEQIWCHGNLSFKPILVCDRCLKEFEGSYVTPMNVIFSPTIPEDFPEEDGIFWDPGEIFIDLTQTIHDLFYLAIPMKILCSPDCKGLCPNCGADLNYESCSCQTEQIDERLAPLLKLKNQFPED